MATQRWLHCFQPVGRRLLCLLLLSAAVGLLAAHRKAPAAHAGGNAGGATPLLRGSRAYSANDSLYNNALRAARSAVDVNDLVSALQHYERAAAARPSSASALQNILNIAVLSLQLGRAPRAETALLAALDLLPHHGGMLNALGQARLQQGRVAEAASAMKASVEKETDATARAQWAANLAAVLRIAGDAAGAREAELQARPAVREQADVWQWRLDSLAAAAPASPHAACPPLSPPLPPLVEPPPDPAFAASHQEHHAASS